MSNPNESEQRRIITFWVSNDYISRFSPIVLITDHITEKSNGNLKNDVKGGILCTHPL